MTRALFVCALAAGAPACVISDVGNPCTAAAPCPAGLACDTAQPGGYCTTACTLVGDLGSRDLSDFTCAVSASADGGLAWAKNCAPAAGCRTGYTCRPPDGGAAVATGVCLFP